MYIVIAKKKKKHMEIHVFQGAGEFFRGRSGGLYAK